MDFDFFDDEVEALSADFSLADALEDPPETVTFDLIFEIGPDVIEQRVLSLAEKTREIVRRHGAR